jgi:hypothetical protein
MRHDSVSEISIKVPILTKEREGRMRKPKHKAPDANHTFFAIMNVHLFKIQQRFPKYNNNNLEYK